MESKHVRIDYEEAIDSKKNLLSSEIGLLHVTKRISSYRALRRKENALRMKLKSSIGLLKTRFSLIESTFPEDSIKPEIKRKTSQKEQVEKPSLEQELKDIQRKLERLG